MIARLRARLRPEVIGAPECPLIHRWTLLELGPRVMEGSGPSRVYKLLLHHFLPTSRERDPHDHPRPFWTFVLWGEYTDESLRPAALIGDNGRVLSEHCGNLLHRETMRAGMVRYRRARHMHRTWAGERGAWTLVLMGPKRREWGFLRGGGWLPWRQYEENFGHGMRCE